MHAGCKAAALPFPGPAARKDLNPVLHMPGIEKPKVLLLTGNEDLLPVPIITPGTEYQTQS